MNSNMRCWSGLCLVCFLTSLVACVAVRVFQVENQINAAIDLRIAAALPLIK